MMPFPDKRKLVERKQKTVTRVAHPLVASPREEYCLALLLQHSELKSANEEISPEYFENSENREIFTAWQQANDLTALKGNLDIAIHEHLESLINRDLPPNQIEHKYKDCVLSLKREHLQNLEAKRAEILALEAESGGTNAELAKLEEEGIERSIQLKEVFAQKGQRRSELRR